MYFEGKKVVVVHYHEIALKGRNREYFEKTLILNLKKSLPESLREKVLREYGRILIFLKKEADQDIVRDKIKKVFGVANFSFGFTASKDISTLKNDLWGHISDKKPTSFRVTVKRSDKTYPKTSQELAVELGSFLYDKFNGKVKVDLKKPDLNCFVEITEKESILYFEKEKAYAGLPVGTAGRVLSLISSGFDSPVASWVMAKRGATISYVHFYSYPYTNKASYENVKSLVEKINEYTFGSKIYFVPFADIQKEISTKCDQSHRVILYRRLMLRIAEKIAEKDNIKALVTGDSLAQVASQTLDNIYVISEAVKIPILRPLIGENKEDVISLAQEIDTFDLSSQPYEDCCSLFMPKNPETHAKIDKIKESESKLDIDSMISEVIDKMEVVVIK